MYTGHPPLRHVRTPPLDRWNLASFARFLEVAALMNGQVVNVAGIARDAAVARPTVQHRFSRSLNRHGRIRILAGVVTGSGG
jgi:hypothetical protein